MRKRFFWAIFGVSAAVIVLLFAVAVGTLNTVRERATKTELERSGEVVAAVFEDNLGDRASVIALLRGEAVDRVSAQLAALQRAAGDTELSLFGINAAGELVGRPAVRSIDFDLERLKAGEAQMLERTGPDGPFLVYVRPLAADIGNVQVFALLVREAPVAIEIPRGLLWGSLIMVALIALFLAQVLSKSMTRRLGSLAGAAGALASGDLGARAEVEGSDELTTVASSFNSMASSMEASRERERQFLLAVGHDLRTPLTTIAGYAEALDEGLDDPAEVQRIAGVLGVESNRLRRLIEDVMQLARLEASEFTLRPEPVQVKAHVEGLLGAYRDHASALRVRLETRLEETGMRTVDPDRIAQILSNLLDNALRYTPETGTVTVALSADHGSIRLSVSDTGPGIEPEDLDHIFDRFYVARKYRGVRPEGSGLGLSIVQALATAMGGSVSAESEPGRGTSIAVTLPAN